ncbi:hypothetical protein L211DRAFT_843293 [Terfezia boudieri ATCC MYA-4762]|uniref:Uncharacterized protein n=1 Tax=Terfezia boudieri ATCC MYA-4762 TaxID=1051890 RepID=A0A3N4LBD3_9PEZI|nr:hypothetical protein L211DRAFT_843293 [Terfezia boudieri ATCC MYA-4762]
MRSPCVVSIPSAKQITRDDAGLPTLLLSCNNQRMPRIRAPLLSSSIQRRMRPGL